jgi:hypothetical protein
MREVALFISNGSDTNRYRDTAGDVIRRVQQLLHTELNYDVALTEWDYRLASPTMVPAGGLAGPSLRLVDRSLACIAIFGGRCPPITREEIKEMVERLQRGEEVGLFVFVNPAQKGPDHDAFFAEIATTYGFEVAWAPYSDRLTFQGTLFTTLMRFLLEHLEIRNPALQVAA